MAGNGRVYLSLEGETATAQLEDHSEGGLRMRSRAALAPGAIVFCAVPSLAICTRARVVHIKRRLLSKSVGLQYLATLSDFA